MALAIPLEERAACTRLARMASLADRSPPPLPTPPPTLEEIGREDLSGRAIRGYELGEGLVPVKTGRQAGQFSNPHKPQKRPRQDSGVFNLSQPNDA
jgi:hypothetical protein